MTATTKRECIAVVGANSILLQPWLDHLTQGFHNYTYLIGRSFEKLGPIQQRLGIAAQCFICPEMTSQAAIRQTVTDVVTKANEDGGLTGVVIAIGSAAAKDSKHVYDQPLDCVTMAGRLAALETNYLIPMAFLQEFAHQLVECNQIVRFVNIGSVSENDATLSIVGAYGAAKCALHQETHVFARKVTKMRRGMRLHAFPFNTLQVGFAITDQNREMLIKQPEGTLTGRGSKIIDGTPLKRFLEPSELIQALNFLTVNCPESMIGTTLTVDGGFSITGPV